MTAKPDWLDLVRTHLAQPSSGWSSGVFGAIAEFEHAAGEAAGPRPGEDRVGVVTPRGALAISTPFQPSLLAYETLSANPVQWRQGLVFCLPAKGLERGPEVLTDLGEDSAALRPEDRAARIFDMGLGRPGVAFCVRSADPDLIALLASASGRSLFDADSPAMAAIKAQSPDRVVTTPLSRIEVYQTIGSTSRRIDTPIGPHTHLLPKLLASGRSHDANIPVPAGLVPLLSLYPAHPTQDQLGKSRPFDATAHLRFQDLLRDFGQSAYCAAKARAIAAMTEGAAPQALRSEDDRVTRTAWRVALRQLVAQGRLSDTTLAAWQALLEPVQALPGTHDAHA
ncbi:MAG: hypothetical protein Kilf2KO_33310 [Rhodospirillales bacterium]